MKILARMEQFSDRLSDHVNPIIVKELRQAVTSWFVIITMIVFLGIQVMVLAGFLWAGAISSGRSAIGGSAFAVLQGILVGTCTFFIPVYTGLRLAGEQSRTDLMFTTSIRPRTIILGKLGAGMVLALVIFSATAPFLTFTYLLRGIDLPTIFIILLLGFLGVAVVTQKTILWATLPISPVTMVLSGLVLLLGILAAAIALPYGLGVLAYSGLGSRVGSPDFRTGVGLLTLLGTWFGLDILLSVALVSPPSSNRMAPVRIYVTLVWLVTGIVALAVYGRTRQFAIPLVWALNFMAMLVILLLVSICERHEWGSRIRRQAGRFGMLRLLVFPWFTGWANGLSWWVLMTVGTLGALLLCNPAGSLSSRQFKDMMTIIGGGTLYAFNYCVSAALIRQHLFPKSIPAAKTWMLVVILLFLMTAVPVLTYFVLDVGAFGHIDDRGYWLVGLPLMLGENSYQDKCVVFATAWAALVTLLVLPGLVGRVVSFYKPAPKPVLPPQTEQLVRTTSVAGVDILAPVNGTTPNPDTGI